MSFDHQRQLKTLQSAMSEFRQSVDADTQRHRVATRTVGSTGHSSSPADCKALTVAGHGCLRQGSSTVGIPLAGFCATPLTWIVYAFLKYVEQIIGFARSNYAPLLVLFLTKARSFLILREITAASAAV
jgi:hypothetical protein